MEITSEWVFQSTKSKSGHLEEPKKVWKRICKKAGLENLHIHDLRHTHGSWMAIGGTSLVRNAQSELKRLHDISFSTATIHKVLKKYAVAPLHLKRLS